MTKPSKQLVVQIEKKHILIFALLIIGSLIAFGIWHQLSRPGLSPEKRAVEYVKTNTSFTDEPTKTSIIDQSTIDKIDRLKQSGARAGDVLIVYEPKTKAIIYRPGADKIVDIIDTTRGDGLDLSRGLRLTILYTSNFKAKAEHAEQTILKIWPEMEGRIETKLTTAKLGSNLITPGPKSNAYTTNDLNNLADKLNLPIAIDPPKQILNESSASVFIYINK